MAFSFEDIFEYEKKARGMTADAYIERQVHELISKYRITVATSDGLEQLTSMSLGALRMPASALAEEIRHRGQSPLS